MSITENKNTKNLSIQVFIIRFIQVKIKCVLQLTFHNSIMKFCVGIKIFHSLLNIPIVIYRGQSSWGSS